jgi:hypothetical protein
LKLVELCFERIFALEPGGALQVRNERVKRAILMMRRTEIAQPRVVFAFEPIAQGGGESRLAYPWLAAEQDDLALT